MKRKRERASTNTPWSRIPRAPGRAVLAVLGAALTGALIIALLGHDPILAYRALFEGAFGGRGGGNFISTLNRVAPIAGLAVAVALALRAGLLNLGGEGQLVLGALATAAVAPLLPAGLGPLAALVALIVGAAAGGLFAGFAWVLAHRCGVPLLVGTLLLNYPARHFAAYMANHPLRDATSGLAQTHRIPDHVMLPLLGGRLDSTLFGIVALTGLLAWFSSQTRPGLRLRIMGDNPRFARAVGLRLDHLGQRAMLASGALAGAVGGASVLAIHHRFIDGALTRPGYAWTALMAALLAGTRPFGALLASLVFAAIQTGGFGMERHAGVPRELSQILQATVILLVAALGHAALGGRDQPERP